jgi:hypothetical protein
MATDVCSNSFTGAARRARVGLSHVPQAERPLLGAIADDPDSAVRDRSRRALDWVRHNGPPPMRMTFLEARFFGLGRDSRPVADDQRTSFRPGDEVCGCEPVDRAPPGCDQRITPTVNFVLWPAIVAVTVILSFFSRFLESLARRLITDAFSLTSIPLDLPSPIVNLAVPS